MNTDQIPPLRGRATVTTVLVVVILIALCLVLWMYRNTPPLSTLFGSGVVSTTALMQGQPINTVSYSCDQGKTITAAYYDGAAGTAANGMPIPGGSVELTLADGSRMSLPQTISADGTRYANADESFVFWGKGNTAFVEQGGTQTYVGCIMLSPAAEDLESWKAFASSAVGFSLRYPQTYAVDTTYKYQALGPGKEISGVKFTIPASMANGTNLSADSYVSVEQLPNASACTADKFLSSGAKVSSVTEGNTDYSVASSSDAGAGNVYNETVYAIPGTSPCTAVRYFIHSTQLGNYPPGTRTAFDQAALVSQFDQIRRTLVLGR